MFKRPSSAAASPRKKRQPRKIHVYDCRFQKEKISGVELETSGLDFNGFLQILDKEFEIHTHEQFVLATTDRTVIDFDKFKELQDGSTLYLLQRGDQTLPVATEEHIKFMPHYDTLIGCGTYEYYASEQKKPLPYALAELIDNALSATAKNKGAKTIELRMLFDESLGKPAVVVLDNGCGMTSKQLNNWAVYRLSKFTRTNGTLGREEGYVRPDPVPRSLNSDISYFGVGGKQAVFYIGDSTRMISKPIGSPDVHELILSKEDFEKKERNKEDIYTGIIKNRKPGDFSHVNKADERFLRALIAEETGKESFTAVVITGILPDHVTFLKEDFAMWTRELAHIYHYYIHGVNGNDMTRTSRKPDDLLKTDIQVTLREKPPRCPRVMNLREVDDDMQTLFLNAAADTFEFKARAAQNSGTVEGVIRYHPFLYDRETYPEAPNAVQASQDDEDCDNEFGVQHQARQKRQIFECFWNGRLIPYTKLPEFAWCAWPGNQAAQVPEECYSRISGVLFTDDRFKVSTNKLTFMDLEMKVKDRDTIFTCVVNGQEQRTDIKKVFTKWLQNCHEKLDKQVKFLRFRETVTRTDVPTKKMQHPWATFSSIEWDGKTYKTGDLVKSQKTNPVLHGTVVRFLLYGEHKNDVFATGGQVEVSLEPKALYDKIKIIPISKIDRTISDEAIRKNIENDLSRLPHKLNVDWREGNPWPENAVCSAGTPLGPLRIEILNKKGDSMSRMPTLGQTAVIKLSVKLQVVKHGPKDEKVVACVAPYIAKWGFEFKKIDRLTNPGEYTLSLNAIINENHATRFGGSALPSYKLKFTIKEGTAKSFLMGAVSSVLRVGVPFNIPLQLKDHYGNITLSPPNLQPVLKCSDLDLSYEAVDCKGTEFIIRGVKARGKVLNYQQPKTCDLKVTLPGLEKDTQTVKINLLPGNPHSLHVKTAGDPFRIENGNPARFYVEIHDEAGNTTAHPKQMVRCQIAGVLNAVTDCSTGAGQLVTKPINLKITWGQPQKLKVQFEMPNQKNVASVVRELEVTPSTRVSLIELFRGEDKNLVLRNNEKIEWLAGGSLESLFYRLYDEAGRAVPLTEEIASMIKVNWTKDINQTDLAQGKLPVVQVATKVGEERFYEVSYQSQSVSVSFTIVPYPNEPTQLKATLPQNTVKLGETLPGIISLKLMDQYDNATKTLTFTCVNFMTVKAEDLDKSAVTFNWQESDNSVEVTGICFQSGTPGWRELCFTYLDYPACVKVEVTAGDPEQLKLVSGPEQVLNDHSIPTPFLVQLFDKWGNPSPDQRAVVELKSSPPTLKVTTAVISPSVDAEGKASFTVDSVSGPKGYYQLVFQGWSNNKPIPGQSVNLTVLPDPNKPVSLSVEYDNTARFPAGGTFPVFSVTVVSDDGSPMTTFNPADIAMFLWEEVTSGNTPPNTASEMKCSKPMEHERKDCFHFRDKDIPERAGKYTIQFSLRINQTKVLRSNPITINVVANLPVRLGPDSQPPAPVVSCSKNTADRILVKNLTLTIMDSYENPAGQDLGGRVVVSITHSSGNSSKNLPLFEGRLNKYHFNLVEGKIHITMLAIMENSPGEDGCEYTLVFRPELLMFPKSLAPFKLNFHFYNDALNQHRMYELLKKKTELTDAVAILKELFDDYKELLEVLTEQHLNASSKESELKNVLIKNNIKITRSLPSPDVARLLTEKTMEADQILKMPRRVFSVRDNFKGQQDVLGMVGHLAYVQNDAAARVISWHISGDMDCIITRTTKAALQIYKDTQGRQQVMALDSVFVSSFNRPLPHIRNGRMLFDPTGNPVYARELLIYPHDPESCDKVFKNILGDTILIDDLQSANDYRRAVVQNKTQCPTILTREGDRISGKGKFGGAHNKAPPMSKLVFGAPLPQEYHALKEQIDLLSQYKAAVEKKENAEKDRADHLKSMKSPETQKKQQDKEEKEKQLKEIEKQLVSKPARLMKRGLEDAGVPSGNVTKRAK